MKNNRLSRVFALICVIMLVACSGLGVFAMQRYRLTLTLDFGSDVDIEGANTNSITIDSAYISASDIKVNGENDTKTVTINAYFTGSNTDGWNLNLDITYDGTLKHEVTDVVVKNRDMSEASATVSDTITWESNATQRYSSAITVTGDKPITAAPTITYTVIFNANGGTGAPDPVSGTDSNITLPLAQPSQTGKTFLGWSLESGAETASYAPGAAVTVTAETTVLYAIWADVGTSSGGGTGTGGNTGEEKTSEPGLTKTSNGKTEISAAKGETLTFELTATVPDYLGEYIQPGDVPEPTIKSIKAAPTSVTRGSYPLVIHDRLDPDMTFAAISSITVNGRALDASLYQIAGTSGAGAEFTITMDLVELYENGYYTLDEIDSCPEIAVIYTANLSSSAAAGVRTNTAWVTYETDKKSVDSNVTVTTYGIDVFKFDQATNAPLPDAEFTLSGDDVSYKGKSDSAGHLVFNGLAAGTYELTETKAPNDYVKSDTPITVNVAEKADKTTYIAEVRFANVAYPHTGGRALLEMLPYLIPGAIVFIGGLAGIAVLIMKKRKTADKAEKE